MGSLHWGFNCTYKQLKAVKHHETLQEIDPLPIEVFGLPLCACCRELPEQRLISKLRAWLIPTAVEIFSSSNSNPQRTPTRNHQTNTPYTTTHTHHDLPNLSPKSLRARHPANNSPAARPHNISGSNTALHDNPQRSQRLPIISSRRAGNSLGRGDTKAHATNPAARRLQGRAHLVVPGGHRSQRPELLQGQDGSPRAPGQRLPIVAVELPGGAEKGVDGGRCGRRGRVLCVSPSPLLPPFPFSVR